MTTSMHQNSTCCSSHLEPSDVECAVREW